MSHHIPRLQYNIRAFTGTLTSGSNVITAIADTSKIVVGDTISGVGIPYNNKVLSKTVSTVTIDRVAGVSGASSLEACVQIVFPYPPIEQNGETIRPVDKDAVSLSGVTQKTLNYIEGRRELQFSHMSQDIFNAVNLFVLTYGIVGKSFRYYDDREAINYVEVELYNSDFKPTKIGSRGANEYVWKFPLNLRRVLV